MPSVRLQRLLERLATQLPDLRRQVYDRHRPPAAPIRPRRTRDPGRRLRPRPEQVAAFAATRAGRPRPGPRSRGPGSRRPLRGLQQRKPDCGGHALAHPHGRRDPHTDPDPDSVADPDCDRDPDPDAGPYPDARPRRPRPRRPRRPTPTPRPTPRPTATPQPTLAKPDLQCTLRRNELHLRPGRQPWSPAPRAGPRIATGLGMGQPRVPGERMQRRSWTLATHQWVVTVSKPGASRTRCAVQPPVSPARSRAAPALSRPGRRPSGRPRSRSGSPWSGMPPAGVGEAPQDRPPRRLGRRWRSRPRAARG